MLLAGATIPTTSPDRKAAGFTRLVDGAIAFSS
jgi:hypothetical protein